MPAKDLKDCAEACLSKDACYVISWADDKCYVQDDGETELKPENLEPRDNSITLLGRRIRLMKLRKFRKLHGKPSNFNYMLNNY